MNIGRRTIAGDAPTYVIAEAGSNHNGDLATAKQLIDVAVDAGADAVKFQTFRAAELYVEDSGTVEYLDDPRPIYEIIEAMEMPYEWIPELHAYCSERAIDFLSTPFDPRSAAELEPYVPAWKVASYTASHLPFLRELAATGKPIIMSTGAHTVEEVAESVAALEEAGVAGLVLLHCVAAYPTPLEAINVRTMQLLAERFDVPVGLSDHTTDPVAAPAAAAALGASVIEKHITLDRTMDGELTAMIAQIRSTATAVGRPVDDILPEESELHEIARRSIYARSQIARGEAITPENTKIVRSGGKQHGLAPKAFERILGARAAQDIDADEPITSDVLEHGG
jgi:N-acetylneuraminate synthase